MTLNTSSLITEFLVILTAFSNSSAQQHKQNYLAMDKIYVHYRAKRQHEIAAISI